MQKHKLGRAARKAIFELALRYGIALDVAQHCIDRRMTLKQAEKTFKALCRLGVGVTTTQYRPTEPSQRGDSDSARPAEELSPAEHEALNRLVDRFRKYLDSLDTLRSTT